MPQQFARLLIADDGEQVLFVVDREPNTGYERLQALTTTPDGGRYLHGIAFEVEGTAYHMLAAVDQEQAELMRSLAREAAQAADRSPEMTLQ